jgi:hypothetical protein
MQMYGQYTRELSEFARQEAQRNYRLNAPANTHRHHADSSTGSLQNVYSVNKSCRKLPTVYTHKRRTLTLSGSNDACPRNIILHDCDRHVEHLAIEQHNYDKAPAMTSLISFYSHLMCPLFLDLVPRRDGSAD